MLLATMLIVASCGEPSYEYVSNKKLGVYFKVPKGWDYDDLTDDEPDDRVANTNSALLWRVGVRGEPPPPDPKTGVAEASAPVIEQKTPQGSAQIFVLDTARRETASISSLRKSAFPFASDLDPLNLTPEQEESLGDSLQVVFAADLRALDPDLTGTRVVMNVRLTDAPQEDLQWLTLDQSILYDDVKGLLYILEFRCTTECYKREMPRIDEVVNSWTVKP